MNTTTDSVIEKKQDGKTLTREESRNFFLKIFKGAIPAEELIAFLRYLRNRGETADELLGLLDAYFLVNRRNAEAQACSGVVDICGTGGDKLGLFNCSTVAAIIAASSGAFVIKHCGRGVTSSSGSRDLLDSFGIKLHVEPDEALRSIQHGGMNIAFLRARFPEEGEATLKKARTEIGTRTIFNLLGVVGNLTKPAYRVAGVTSPQKARVVAEVLRTIGVVRALVVSGADGADKITTHQANTICLELREGVITESLIGPANIGVPAASLCDLRVENVTHSHNVTKDLFYKREGAPAHMACLNAGAALYVSGRADSIKEGYEMALANLHSDEALRFFHTLHSQHA